MAFRFKAPPRIKDLFRSAIFTALEGRAGWEGGFAALACACGVPALQDEIWY